jgi:hypothetical protein
MRKEEHLREADVKTEQTFYNDLCSTCNHADICVSKKTRQGPVWFCEEFDDYVAVKELYDTTLQGTDSQDRISAGGDNTGQFKGLCINCENRHTCNYLKPNGGVWHCEEYK